VFLVDQPVPLHRLIGRRLRALREATRRRQEDVAAAARGRGFDWVRGTVAAIETGGRRVTAEELVALPTILRDAGLGDLSLGELVGGAEDGMVRLSEFTGVPGPDLRAVLRGERGVDLWPLLGTDRATGAPEAREAQRLWTRFRPGRTPPSKKAELYRIALESRGEAEMKVARALGVSPVVVAMAAQRCWHQSLTSQRDADALVAVFGGRIPAPWKPGAIFQVPPRKLQALRGHITRKLVKDLVEMCGSLLTDLPKRRKRRAR
jgi:hypothetical protein